MARRIPDGAGRSACGHRPPLSVEGCGSRTEGSRTFTEPGDGSLRMRWRYLLPLGVVILLMGLLAVGLRLNPREVPSPLVGKAAPVFVLPTLHDPQKTFGSADLQGEVSLFNVWASWCATCRDEADVLL